MKSEPIVKVEHLSIAFGPHLGSLPVLNDLSFDVAEGKVVCFVGPSGCGKTTILNILAGLTPCDGKVSIGGKTPADASSGKNIGFAFQDAVLIGWKTVIDNVLLPSEIGPDSLQHAAARPRAESLLEMVGLSDFKHFYPDQLSGGMRQRVAFARALLLEPQLLLLDEPFSSLDAITRLRLMVEFKSILDRMRTTTILVTHDLTEAAYLADHIYILSDRPATIVHHLEVSYPYERNIDLLDKQEFINVASFCRQKLFENA